MEKHFFLLSALARSQQNLPEYTTVAASLATSSYSEIFVGILTGWQLENGILPGAIALYL